MKTRILTSLVGVPLILVLLFWPGGLPWFCFVAAVMAMAIYEFTKALWAKGIYVHWIALAVAGATTLFCGAPRPGESFGALDSQTLHRIHNWVSIETAAVLIMLLLAGDLIWNRRAPLKNLGATFVGMVWITFAMPFLVQIRGVGVLMETRGGQPFFEMPFGIPIRAWLVLSVLLVIWAGDSGAYFVGRAIGKHKMAPAISPNKTWEGAIGGLAASWLVGHWMVNHVGLYTGLALVFGLIVGAAGQIGDLFESAIKREIGIKDFGNLLPGHGGVLDRFDSLLFAAPVAYLLLYPDGLLRWLLP